MNIAVIESRTVYEGPVFSIRQDLLQLPNGNTAQIDVVDHRPSVTILPIDEQGQICFIQQYRQPIGMYLLELPAGVAQEGEQLEQSAMRELREEIGMGAGIMIELGSFYLAPGYSSEFMRVYLARNLYPDPLPADQDEILEVKRVSAAEAYKWAEDGQIQDSKSIITLFWAKPHLIELGLLG